MKWKNRYINVVEQANIPQFSRLDNIVTPLKRFESFFVDVLVDIIVGFIQLCDHREKAGTILQNF